MKKICIFNIKGGVGKTTTALNLAAGLSRKDKRVLLIDLDPQGNIDASLNLKPENTLFDAVIGNIQLSQAITNVAKNLDIIPSADSLGKLETYLSGQASGFQLREMLNTISGYDYIIMDCPPSLGIVNENALTFCNEAFVPVSTDYLGYNALAKMHNIIDKINSKHNTSIKITKVIPTMYDRRNRICKETLIAMQQEFPELVSYPIRYNSKLKEAPKHGKSIFSYAKSSAGAQDYGQLAEDVVAMKNEFKEHGA